MSVAATKVLQSPANIKPLEDQIGHWKKGLDTMTVKVLHVTRYVGLATAVIAGLGTLIMTGVFLATTLPVVVPIAFAATSIAGLAVYLAVHVAPNIRAYDNGKSGSADKAPTEAYLKALERGARNSGEDHKQVKGKVVDLYLSTQANKILSALLDPAKRNQVTKLVGDFTDCFDHFVEGADDTAKAAAAEALFGDNAHFGNYPLITLLKDNVEALGAYCDGLKTKKVEKETLFDRIRYLSQAQQALPQELDTLTKAEVVKRLVTQDGKAEDMHVAVGEAIATIQKEQLKALRDAWVKAMSQNQCAKKAVEIYHAAAGNPPVEDTEQKLFGHDVEKYRLMHYVMLALQAYSEKHDSKVNLICKALMSTKEGTSIHDWLKTQITEEITEASIQAFVGRVFGEDVDAFFAS